MKHIFLVTRSKGSALMIAMLMMATLGAVSFTASRLYLSATKTSTNYADSASAYYGAESGLERAMLEFTKNNDVQYGGLCVFTSDSDCVVNPSLDPLVLLPDTGDSKVSLRMTAYSSVATPDEQIRVNCPQTPCVTQDQTKEISIPKDESKTPTLNWVWKDSKPGVMRIMYSDNDDPYDNSKSYVIDNRSESPQKDQTSQSLAFATTHGYTVLFRPRAGELESYWITFTDSNPHVINTGITTIDVVGEFKGVKRQLHASIGKTGDDSRLGLSAQYYDTISSEESID